MARTRICDMSAERVSAFLDGDLSAAECRKMAAHARTCAHCKRLATALRETVGECQTVGTAPLPPGLRKRALARVRLLLAERDRRRATPVKRRGTS